MKVNAVIPAKGNSERVANKNQFMINGKTLVYMACEKLLKSKSIDEVYLDTDSDDIISSTKSLQKEGLHIIKRPVELANNDISANDLIMYALHSTADCDLMLQTFCTSPLITSDTIDQCVDEFVSESDRHGYDSFFTAVEMQEYFWKKDGNSYVSDNFDTKSLPNSFELDPIIMETHGLYGIWTKDLIKYKTRVGSNPLPITISNLESLDINEYSDLEMLERLLK